MEAFYGTWKVQLEKTSGVAEFGKLLGWTDEKIQMFSAMGYTLHVEPTDNGSRCVVDYGVRKLEFVLTLGEPFDYVGLDDLKAKCTPVLEGGKLLEKFQTDEGISWQTVREVSGSSMTATTTLTGSEDVKCVQVFQKV